MILDALRAAAQRLLGFSRSEKLLIASQSVSTVGDLMALPAFMKLALARGEHVVALFLVCNFLPRIFQPFLGALVDRFSAKQVALVAELGRAVVFISLFAYPAERSTVGWLLLPLLGAFLGCVFEPARLKMMSNVSRNFAELNTAFYFFYSATGILSLFLSVVVETYSSTEAVFLLNAVTFIISYAILAFVAYHPASNRQEGARGWRYLVDGILSLCRNRKVLTCVAAVVFIDFFTGVFYELFAKKSEVFGFSDYGVYIYSFSICAGNTVGSLLIPWAQRCIRAIGALLVGTCVSVSVFLFTSNWVVSLSACFGFFIFQIIAIATAEIFIEESFDHRIQGRVFAINESLPILALSLGSLASTFISEYILIAIMIGGIISYALFVRMASEHVVEAPSSRLDL